MRELHGSSVMTADSESPLSNVFPEGDGGLMMFSYRRLRHKPAPTASCLPRHHELILETPPRALEAICCLLVWNLIRAAFFAQQTVKARSGK